MAYKKNNYYYHKQALQIMKWKEGLAGKKWGYSTLKPGVVFALHAEIILKKPATLSV